MNQGSQKRVSCLRYLRDGKQSATDVDIKNAHNDRQEAKFGWRNILSYFICTLQLNTVLLQILGEKNELLHCH